MQEFLTSQSPTVATKTRLLTGQETVQLMPP